MPAGRSVCRSSVSACSGSWHCSGTSPATAGRARCRRGVAELIREVAVKDTTLRGLRGQPGPNVLEGPLQRKGERSLPGNAAGPQGAAHHFRRGVRVLRRLVILTRRAESHDLRHLLRRGETPPYDGLARARRRSTHPTAGRSGGAIRARHQYAARRADSWEGNRIGDAAKGRESGDPRAKIRFQKERPTPGRPFHDLTVYARQPLRRAAANRPKALSRSNPPAGSGTTLRSSLTPSVVPS